MRNLSVAQNECLVPETETELYDCCGSLAIESECRVFGIINVISLAAIVISIFVLPFRSQWWYSNWLLTFICMF